MDIMDSKFSITAKILNVMSLIDWWQQKIVILDYSFMHRVGYQFPTVYWLKIPIMLRCDLQLRSKKAISRLVISYLEQVNMVIWQQHLPPSIWIEKSAL